ncbi:efflux RND transporter periplasmic adaptor subunit [Brevundimonas sp.]|uniref:efflux RND transporter periplasmic adaptor subunit n=1 Tax=Brevundimonas sp. TaxID=1871086 RepID=UPI0028A09378|nr:efflux RND transporter periplasmic adaptor subunit [Brevundimonas sp.]
MRTFRPSSRILLATSCVLTLGLAACGEEKKPEPPSTTTVSAITTTQASMPRMVVASGTVSAWEEVPVGAETGGLTATVVHVDEGSYVRQGQPLVQMNDVLLRAQMRQQQASVQTAEANVARDDAALARAQELKEKGFLSQAALDKALADQRASAANLAAARAGLAETRTRVEQAVIRAPVSGQIISRSVTRGQIIQQGAELFRMVRDGRLELDAQIPETDLPALAPGQSARITASQVAPTTGTVRIVTPEVDAQTRLGIARISLAPNSGLKAGMFARAEISAGTRDATVVPTAAVLYRNNKSGVFVIEAGNKVRFVPVTVLMRDDTQTSVGDLPVGARVAVQGAGFLNDGDAVTVARAVPATTAPATAPAPAAAQK